MGSSATERKPGRIVFADVLGEGLALLVAALALALEAMAEDFVEEDGGGAAGENGGAVEGLGDRSFAQRLEALAERAHGGFEIGLLGQAVDGFGFEGLLAEEVHAVVGAGDGDGDEARLQMRRDDSASPRRRRSNRSRSGRVRMTAFWYTSG